jgi:hypothetical protein
MAAWQRKHTCCGVLVAAIVSFALVTTSAALPDPPLAAGVLGKRSDGWYKAAAQTMAFRARLAGVRIGADLHVGLTARGHVFFAPLADSDERTLLEDAGRGVNIGFMYLSDDTDEAPAGYYLVRVAADGDATRPAGERSALAWLIGEDGDSFPVPVAVNPDPNSERGPGLSLTTESRTSFGTISVTSCPKGPDSCVILFITTTP